MRRVLQALLSKYADIIDEICRSIRNVEEIVDIISINEECGVDKGRG